ncbi:MAG TPA: FAD-binding oxidoreductase [Vicinamibacterales bacterium]|nr:FAD-binding oxidoreductase [Vicinamibacterales bacterium]
MLQPANAAEVAAALRRASEARQSIVIRGAGTKSEWGRPAARVDAVLDMRRVNRILAHEHGDMTATVEAGATLHDVNAALAIHGQTLPLDPPFADRATIGGLLATNDSGPLRHRYGTPRDLVIGIQLATTDGVLTKAGGQVVKNVAGYDLSKLVTGSFGSLAAIISATFKLAPLPAASKTLRIGVGDKATVAEIVRRMMASQLEPAALEVVVGHRSLTILIRFASLAAVVDAQIAQATAVIEGCATDAAVLDGDAERALWHELAAAIWNQPGAIVRASWLPAQIAAGLGELDRLTACTTSVQARAAIGAGLIRIDGDAPAQATVIEQLRRSPVFGNVVIRRGSDALKAVVDVWGPHGDRRPLFDSLKRAFDPNGVLNAGRGPL